MKSLIKSKNTDQTATNRCRVLLALDENHPPAMSYDQCVKAYGLSKATIATIVKEMKVILDEPISREAIRRTLKKPAQASPQ